MQPVEVLTTPDRQKGRADTDAAAAAYWLRHPESPQRQSTFADLIRQWETEPEWTPDAGQEDTDECPE